MLQLLVCRHSQADNAHTPQRVDDALYAVNSLCDYRLISRGSSDGGRLKRKEMEWNLSITCVHPLLVRIDGFCGQWERMRNKDGYL